MRIERDKPRAHLVVENFFEEATLATIFREVHGLEGEMKAGLVREVGHDGQSVFFEHERRQNKAIWIHDPSPTLSLFRERLWSPAMLEAFDEAREPLFQIIPSCSAPHLQVSTYMTGDHYDFHEDEGAGVNLTAVVFLATDPKRVRGGDFILAYRGEQTTIGFRHNRLLVFPSKTPHRVTKVTVDSSDTKHARVSLQCWLTYGKQESSAKPRAPEADRPTFLLVEPSIIAAAQAMIDTGGAAEQTVEDVYWGAFYLSRILTQNLRCLVAGLSETERGRDAPSTLDEIRIRRGGVLEVYGRVTTSAARAAAVRVGFQLRGGKVPLGDALSLFVETGTGRTRSRTEGAVPAGATEKVTIGILRRLMGRGRP